MTLKIALIEASHWHVPLYIDSLSNAGAQVVAVSDGISDRGIQLAKHFGCSFYQSYQDLIANASFDTAFAFGRHIDMPIIAELLINYGAPFSIEKPCGISASDVARVRDRAADAGVSVAIPFIFRLSDTLRIIRGLSDQEHDKIYHASFRFIAGPMSRYLENGSAWMLQKNLAGGGCTINLAVHFIDLIRLLTGCDAVSVTAKMASSRSNCALEEYSLLILNHSDGTCCTIETGYTFPGKNATSRDFSFALSSRHYYAKTVGENIHVHYDAEDRNSPQVHAADLDTDHYYPMYVSRVLSDIESGADPIADLNDLCSAMRVIDAGYASAHTDGCVKNI